jgi:alkanesulfonate monooxygenase SsuD/methylene tetrahydromethanopterin reductase-like flavin-dependent oxidoreductase (luciferase family)
MTNSRFCLEVWGTDYTRIKEICQLAEKLGYFGFYYGESLADIDMDCWTVISSLASITKKIKLGPVITYLFPAYRNIVLLAKQAMTMQDISDQRLEFRTGAGAPFQWASQWWHPFGIDYPNNSERVLLLEEGMKLLLLLWSDGHPITFEGRQFRVKDATLSKKQRQPDVIPPVTIAANRVKTMQIAAKYAHIWECSYLTPEQFTTLNKKFEDIFEKTQRSGDRNMVTKSIELDVVISASESDLEYKKRMFELERGPGVVSQMLKHGLIGTPERIRERLRNYLNAGVDQFLLAFQDPFDSEAIELFMESVDR